MGPTYNSMSEWLSDKLLMVIKFIKWVITGKFYIEKRCKNILTKEVAALSKKYDGIISVIRGHDTLGIKKDGNDIYFDFDFGSNCCDIGMYRSSVSNNRYSGPNITLKGIPTGYNKRKMSKYINSLLNDLSSLLIDGGVVDSNNKWIDNIYNGFTSAGMSVPVKFEVNGDEVTIELYYYDKDKDNYYIYNPYMLTKSKDWLIEHKIIELYINRMDSLERYTTDINTIRDNLDNQLARMCSEALLKIRSL